MTDLIAQEEAVTTSAEKPTVRRKLRLEDIVASANIADKLTKNERGAFGQWVINGYMRDRSTRTEWEQRNADAMKLALQVKEDKNFPWTNCSNVKFPLVTIGALQFVARISILTKGRSIARFESVGADPTGQKAARAKRISQHVSMQLTDEDIGWLDSDESAKFSCSLLGSAFKKSYFDPVKGSNISEFVPAQNIVFDYHCRHLETTRRVTHLIPMDVNKITERVRRGLFIEEPESAPPPGPAPAPVNLLENAKDERQGTRSQGSIDEYKVLEQHCWFDFDGDGYEEPYIMSVREDTGHLYRIVARFTDAGDVHRKHDLAVRQAEMQARDATDIHVKARYEQTAERLEKDPDNWIVRIDPVKYFTKYTFIPSPDGGAYGLGLGALLGPVNASVNTLINQLIDAGTMSNNGAGFLGRGVKLKGGKTSFDPFEWKPVDSTGDDLRKNIFPLPVREPSEVLFNLLGILIKYGEKISSATDIMTGVSPGQNTPAETSRNTVEQGMMLFSGIYARMYRAFREELTILYDLNRLYLRTSPKYFDLTQGPDAILAPEDYGVGQLRVFPTADPSTVTGQQRKDKVDKLVAFAASPLGAKLNKDIITRKWLEAYEYDEIDQIFPDPNGPQAVKPPANPKVQLEQAKLQQSQQQHQDEMQLAVAQLKAEIALNEGKIAEAQARATLALSQADGVDRGHEIALLDAQIGAAKAQNDTLLRAADLLLKANVAKSGVEKTLHGMTMDLHDRMKASQPGAGENSPETSPTTDGGAAPEGAIAE